MAVKKASYTFGDFSHELAGTSFNVASTASFGDLTGLQAAIDAISLCSTRAINFTETDLLTGAWPTDVWANRESKVLIGYSDAVNGQKYTMTIPGPDLDLLTFSGGTDYITLADGSVMAALVTAMEVIVKSPDDNAINVDSLNTLGVIISDR